jgi:hypothetical protein
LLQLLLYFKQLEITLEEIKDKESQHHSALKYFFEYPFRKKVLNSLKWNLYFDGVVPNNTFIKSGILVSKILGCSEMKLQTYFEKENWLFFGPSELNPRKEFVSCSV